MSAKKPVALMGRIAVQLKMINMDQLAQATEHQGRVGEEKRLGDIFLELGFINPAQLEKLKSVQLSVIEKHREKQAATGRTVAPDATPHPSPAAASPPKAAAAESPAPRSRAASAPEPGGASAQPRGQNSPASAGPEARPVAQARTRPEAAAASAPSAPNTPTERAKPAAAAAPTPVEDEDTLELVLPSSSDADLQRLHQLLRSAVEAGASDIHVHCEAPPKVRLNGILTSADPNPIPREEVERMVTSSLNEEQREILARTGEIDFCYEAPGVGRYRANAYRQQRGFDLVLRSVYPEPPTLDQLGLPSELAKYTNYHQGMVLITGPAGCGKSATMAALVNLVNEEREEHILCIEDPIEVVHPSKRCLVNQRHAGKHTSSFARALRGALREDPDVIVIGELRDLETISLAMTAAETGHFVLATLHTNNAVRTINRMIGAFPSNQQGQVRTMLSESLRAVISQRLVPTADESGRIPALEVLVINKAIGNLIRDEKTVQIRSAIQTGKAHGMYLLEQHLNELVQSKKITRETALRFAEEEKLITAQ